MKRGQFSSCLRRDEAKQMRERRGDRSNFQFSKWEHGTWSLCEVLLPHAFMCAKWATTLRQKNSAAAGARLLSVTGRYLCNRARYADAEPLLQRALTIREERLEAFHPE